VVLGDGRRGDAVGRSTVKTHLSRIYAKLGITSRTELAAMAAARLES